MRIIHLDSHQLTNLDARDSGDRWLKALAGAGVVRGDGAPAGSPQEEMHALYTEAWQLVSLEETLAAARVTDAITLAPPRRWWLSLPMAYVASFFIALTRTEFGDRLRTFGGLLVAFSVLAVGLGVWICAATWSLRRRKRAAGAAAAALRSAVVARMLRRRDALLERPFALRAGEALVVNAPDLRWVEAQLRALPVQGAAMRRAALQQARARIREGVQALYRSPPTGWSAAGLTVDRAPLEEGAGG